MADLSKEKLRILIQIRKKKLQLQQQPKESLLKRGLDIANKPRELSRKGLTQIAEAIPEPELTGNLPADIIRGTPKIAAETLAETAPEFVSPLALGLGAGAKSIQLLGKTKVVGKAGKLIAKGAQQLTGIQSESFINAFKKPLALLTSPTKVKVSEVYSKSEIGNLDRLAQSIDDIVEKGTSSFGAFVKRASNIVKKTLRNPNILKTETGQASFGKTNLVSKKIVEGRKALDKQIGQLRSQIDSAKASTNTSALEEAIRDKEALRTVFNEYLDVIAPGVRQADKAARTQKLVDPFRQASLPGNISLISPRGILKLAPGLPTALGTGTSALGAALKIASSGPAGLTAGSASQIIAAQLQRLRESGRRGRQ